jgi:hypothetical protein
LSEVALEVRFVKVMLPELVATLTFAGVQPVAVQTVGLFVKLQSKRVES